jgi:hypothetical protein
MMRRRIFSITGGARGRLRWAAVATLAALALLGLPAGPALAGAAVSDATIQVSSLSASATEVSYTVSFDSTAAMTGGTSTVTLAAPSGTALPSPSDVCYNVSDDASAAHGCGAVTVTGTSAKITLPAAVNVAAGDPVTVLAPGVGNPTSAGAKTLKVSTSADTTAVSLPYTLVAKRSVSDARLQVSSSSASATGVSYSVTFQSPDRLSLASQITVKFPAGTSLPSGGCSQVDWIDDTNGSTGCPGVTIQGTTATATDELFANPGDMVTIVFYGVKSPGSAGTHDVTLQTTSDPKPVTLTYTLQAKRSVSDPFLQLSSYAARASGVNWTIGFVAPDRLTDSGAGSSSSTVIIKAPTGTVFPVGGCSVYYFIDASPAGSQGPENGCTSATVTGSSVAVTAGFDTNPGNTVFVVIKGVTNPATMSSVSVSTSADPGTVSLPLTAPTNMSATDQISSTSAAAKEVTYAETFRSTGPLTNGTSTVTLSSTEAVFPVCSASTRYTLIDDTTGGEAGLCPVSTGPAGSVTATYNAATTTAGDEITVLAYGVTNSAASGSGTFSVTTSSAGGASLPIDLTSKTSISSPVLSLVSTSASATFVAYSATFTVANGFMVSGAGDDLSTIALKAATGTKFPASGIATVINDATGAVGGSSFTSSGRTATVLPGSGGNLGAGPGDEISVIVWGATDPSSAGADTASISTTSDPGAVSAAYTLTAKTSVADDIVQLSSRTAGASGVTYSFTFRTTNALVTSGNSDSTITVKLPAGTGMPPTEDVGVTDDTIDQACGGASSSSGTTATVVLSTLSCPGELGAGDVVTLVLTGVTNASSLSGASITLSTSSDPAAVTTALP